MCNSVLLLSFSLFVVLISFVPPSSSSSNNNNNKTHKCSTQETHALLLFKKSLSSINHSTHYYRCYELLGSEYYRPLMMNWTESSDCCKWDGVTCNHLTGDVIALDLTCGGLRGTIHPNTTLLYLHHLRYLNLAFNDLFDGSSYFLSQVIGRFANTLTHLNISHNSFTGQVPAEISFLPKLASLDLSYNSDLKMQPYVLNNLLQNSTGLRYLVMGGVNVSGVLPTYLNKSSSLKTLDLWNTSLVGRLPTNIFNLQFLEELLLGWNNGLTGPLPKANMSNGNDIPLSGLDLSFTNFSAREIIDSIGHLKSLRYLTLFDCGLMGPLPNSLVNLRHLITLDLSGNMLNGTLPSFLFTLPTLEEVYLGDNMLSGGLPTELFNCQSLHAIDLSVNQFDGEIHGNSVRPSFTQLPNLTLLGLSNNNFTGVWDLDTLLSTLPKLVFLDLSYSGLSVVTNNTSNFFKRDFDWLGLASCMLTVFPQSLQAMKNLQYLDLSSNNIQGRIPDWAGDLGRTELLNLNLSYNFITVLPQFQWDRLEELCLQHNQIEGPVPSSICNMSLLIYLDLSNNRFSGVVPQCLGNIISKAYMVNLANNYIHGKIPKVHDDCTILESLLLNGNHFEGEVPRSLSKCRSLYVLNLGNNYLSGKIPNIYSNWESLQGLILNGNYLEGEVPSSLSKCRYLRVLDLGNNNLNGTFPRFLSQLPDLQVLVLKSNNFHGIIDTSSTMTISFPSLQVLDLSSNGFVGHLPGKYFQNFTAMKGLEKRDLRPEYLQIYGEYYSIEIVVKDLLTSFTKLLVNYIIVDLSNNKFEGEIPKVIGNLNLLKSLNLSHNNLNGQIPYSLGQLLEIESLDLSWNQLTGEIPKSLADIYTLAVLNLSQNHLEGHIPEGTQFGGFDSSFGGNPKLCGRPLPNKCEQPHEAPREAEKDIESESIWQIVVLGFGCGIIPGVVIGYVMMTTGRPKWFNAIVDALERR